MPLENALIGKLLTRRRFTVDEYHRMGGTGILPEDSTPLDAYGCSAAGAK